MSNNSFPCWGGWWNPPHVVDDTIILKYSLVYFKHSKIFYLKLPCFKPSDMLKFFILLASTVYWSHLAEALLP
jgi:hypothetical protein